LCGIAGYIGNPINEKATFDLINQLMIKTEVRGEHATGFWATLNSKQVLFHKEPVKSSIFVKHDLWRDLENKYTPDLLIGHCRWTSLGGGSEKINKNNHPHVSKDYRVALVHNGKIPEYNYLKKKYNTVTDCDSEILLRIFESGETYHDQISHLRKSMPKIWEDTPDQLMHRIFGLKQIFSEVNYGAMAVAVGERLEGKRSLFLFRNNFRPITIIDLRKSLGQIFFASTPELFRQAWDSSELAKSLIPADQPVIELPDDWIYSFVLDHNNIEIRRLKVNKTRRYGQWEQNEEEQDIEIPKSTSQYSRSKLDVITNLDDSEEPIIESKSTLCLMPKEFSSNKNHVWNANEITKGKHHYKRNPYGSVSLPGEDFSDDVDGSTSTLRREHSVSTNILNKGFQEIHENEEILTSAKKLTTLCEKATNLLDQIGTHVYNTVQEGSMSQEEINEIIESLKETITDLESTKCILKM
jgi:predicted glutamine amidotransferase